MVRHQMTQNPMHIVPANLNKNNSNRNKIVVQMKIRKNRQTIQTHSRTITTTMEIIVKMANHAVTVIKQMAEIAEVVAVVVAVLVTVVLLQKHQRLSMKSMRETKKFSATTTITIT